MSTFTDGEQGRLDALRARFSGHAFVPVLVAGDDARAETKLGGTPWLPDQVAWPTCQGCALPMHFIFQLARASVPGDTGWAFRDDLIQVFSCMSAGRAGDPEWICAVDGSLTTTRRTTLIRQVSAAGASSAVSEVLAADVLRARRTVHLEGLVAYARRVGDLGTAARFERELASRPPTHSADFETPATLADHLQRHTLLYPAQRVAGWTAHEDVPAYEDPLDLDEIDDLEEHFGLHCLVGDKLGGFPAWRQSPPKVRCDCGETMRFLFQLASQEHVPAHFGGDGTAYLHVCPSCHESALPWQR